MRIAPHLNDAVLLTAAITLAVMCGQYPAAQGWLTAKGGGAVRLWRAGQRRAAAGPARGAEFIAALTSVGYIVGVAITRSATMRLP